MGNKTKEGPDSTIKETINYSTMSDKTTNLQVVESPSKKRRDNLHDNQIP